MTASVLAMTGQLNESPRFITLARQFASGHDMGVGSARVSRIPTFVSIGDSGLFGLVARGIGRWLVAGGWPVVARLVAGDPALPARKETRLKARARTEPLKYGAGPGEVLTDALGQTWTPKLDRKGRPIIRPTRPGDRFLAKARRTRIVECRGNLFRGLVRQIVVEVN